MGGVLIMAAAVLGAEDAFPEDGTFPFVSAVLLLILWRAMCGETRTPGDVANVLGMILLPVLTVVVLFGLGDLRWEENAPERWSWYQVYVTVAASSPWWCLHRGAREKRTWAWFGTAAAVSLGMSLLTRGILGCGLVEREPFPLYRAAQTIRILGVLQRFEALLAAAVLMGTFCILLLVGEQVTAALKIFCPEKPGRWAGGAVVMMTFLVECGFRWLTEGAEQNVGTVFWGAIPILALWVVLVRKSRKNEKSS